VNFTLVEIEELTGEKLKVYSIITQEDEETGYTLYDRFIEDNINIFKTEVEDITNRIEIIARYTGLRDDFIKPGEGNLGDGINALYDKPGSNLRLYFIRFGNVAIVLGGGGHKSKSIRRFQEDPVLKEANFFLRKVSAALTEAVRDGSLSISNKGLESQTDFNYKIEDDE
jgi:putative component of toxin-antitoxin plasmid stabilization module